ncbi:MAG: RNA methyltransferase substrate-binding domain-containing protein, partial [Hyphomicrobium sp.]
MSKSDVSKEPHRKPWQKDSGRKAPHGGHFSPRGSGSHGQRRHERGDGDRQSGEGPLRLFGMHPVEAALRNPARKVRRLVLTENAERRLVEAVGVIAHPIERASPRELDKILGTDAVHQGAMLETEDLPEPDFADLIALSGGRPLIVLDQVTDPHNVGAILRSAAAFGAAGLVMTRRH